MKNVLKDSARPSLLTNTEKALLVLELLYRHNCRVLVISPGSRSTPLTVLAARDARFETIVVHDERGAGGFALGYARASCQPAALICTSGSAAANYYPAIVEASTDEIPMFVVTADRPEYLHGTGANQTMFQNGMFSEYVVGTAAESSFETAQDLVQHLVSRIPNVVHGPVHLNVEFDKPLEPEEVEASKERVDTLVESCDSTESSIEWQHKRGWYEHKEAGVLEFLESVKSQVGAVIIGRLASRQEMEIALSIAMILECPAHIDVTTHIVGSHLFELVPRWDSRFAEHTSENFEAPQTVVHIGGKFVECAQTREILAQVGTCIHITPFRSVIHHGSAQHRVFAMPEYREVEDVATALYSRTRPQQLVREFLPPQGSTSEVLLVKQCIVDSGGEADLWLASSMTIRYAQAVEQNIRSRVYANRGVSGIDITIASACGASYATETTVNCVLGDMAFLHDCNSLALLRLPGVDVQVHVLNNSVGGIFHRLPIAAEADVFEPYFLTPTEVQASAIAVAFGVGDRVHEHLTDAEASLPDLRVARDFSRYSVRGLELPYEVYGHGPKTVVLLHGFAGCPRDWQDIIERLGPDFTCIVPHLHAEVHSDRAGERSFVSLAASLASILQEQAVERYGVVGYSMGGRIARYWQRVAFKTADWMVLESSHPGLASHVERQQRITSDKAIARKLDVCTTPTQFLAFFKAWYENPLFGQLRHQPGFEEVLQRRSGQRAELLASSLRTVGLGHQPHLKLSETQCKTELVVGRLDTKFLRIAQQEQLEHGVALHIAENASHNVHSEDPDYFVANIMNIVESVWSE